MSGVFYHRRSVAAVMAVFHLAAVFAVCLPLDGAGWGSAAFGGLIGLLNAGLVVVQVLVACGLLYRAEPGAGR